jgi:hypothetical protein
MSEADVDRHAAEDLDNPPWLEEEPAAARLVAQGDRPEAPMQTRQRGRAGR